MEYCKLTGVELTDVQPCPIKKMCLNCSDSILNEDGTYACGNEKVMEKGRDKALAAIQAANIGYEVDTLTLKPMLLKDPTKKCGNYDANEELILSEIKAIFSL